MRIDLPVKPSLLPYCRKLVAGGTDPATILHIYRGSTLRFAPAPLAVFASLATEERADQPVRFIRHRKVASQGDEYATESGVKPFPDTSHAERGKADG